MNEKLKLLVAEILAIPADSIDADTSAKTQSRWDSLRHMNLMFAIEESYGVRFEDEEIARLVSVSSIEAALAMRGIH
jgi:acyl carrier protein